MSREAVIVILVGLLAAGALLATRAGIRSIQSARRVSFFRVRRTYMLAGWRWLLAALLLFSASFTSLVGGERMLDQFFPSTPGRLDLPSATSAPTKTSLPSETTADVAASTATDDKTGPGTPTSVSTVTATPSPATPRTDTAVPSATSSPTRTPAPTTVPASTRTATPDRACDRIEVVADINVPKDSVFAPGSAFTKIWRLRNVGTCTWTTSYRIVLIRGELMGGQNRMPLPHSVAPGDTIDLRMDFVAPQSEGTYRGDWQLQNDKGAIFNMASTANVPFALGIRVDSPPATGTVYDFVASACAAHWANDVGVLPCPGPGRSADGIVQRHSLSRLEDGTLIVRPSLLTAPRLAPDGRIQGVYPPFRIQAGDRFRAIAGCEGAATGCDVIFQLEVWLRDGSMQELWSSRETFDGTTTTVNVDLASLAGQEVRFILTVLASGPASGDRALWVEPRIVRSVTATPTP